jgi:hypothetical protein
MSKNIILILVAVLVNTSGNILYANTFDAESNHRAQENVTLNKNNFVSNIYSEYMENFVTINNKTLQEINYFSIGGYLAVISAEDIFSVPCVTTGVKGGTLRILGQNTHTELYESVFCGDLIIIEYKMEE